MKHPNKNIKVRYWCGTYYVQMPNGKFRKVSDRSLIVKNCGSKSKHSRIALAIPIQWDIGELNEIVFNNAKVHDWYTAAFFGSTDSFVNQFVVESSTYVNDPVTKYPF
jgi:hypothetical protein